MSNKKALVIAGFPGVGKSSLYNSKKYVVSDSDSSHFPKDDFPNNYIKHIKSLIDKNEHDYILVSSHKEVIEALIESGIVFVLVYPDKSLKEHYLERYRERGSDDNFINLLNDKWSEWIDDCQSHKVNKLRLTHETHNLMNCLKFIDI